MHDVKTIEISIKKPLEQVYQFITNGENLPQWANGLGEAVERQGDGWVAHGPLGDVMVRFSEPNRLGVADHDVTLPTGQTVHNPMRVIENDEGSTVMFTLVCQPEMTAEELEADARMVEEDLARLKQLLENR